MRKVNYKGRCTKRKLPKCKDVCRTFDDIQLRTAEILQANDEPNDALEDWDLYPFE